MPVTGLEVKAAVSATATIIETLKAIGPFVHHGVNATQRLLGVPGAVLAKTDLNLEAILDILESEAGQKIPPAERQELVEYWRNLNVNREALGPCTSLRDSLHSASEIKALYADSKTLKFQAKISSRNARASGALSMDVADIRKVNDSTGKSAVVDVFIHVLNQSRKARRKTRASAVICSDLLSHTISEISELHEDSVTPFDDDGDSASFQSVSSRFESDQDSVSTGSDQDTISISSD